MGPVGLMGPMCPTSPIGPVRLMRALARGAHPDRRLADQARDHIPAVVLLDEHELPAPRLRVLDGKHHRTTPAGLRALWPGLPRPGNLIARPGKAGPQFRGPRYQRPPRPKILLASDF